MTQRERYHIRKAAGLCTYCGKVPVTKKRRIVCKSCVKKQVFYNLRNLVKTYPGMAIEALQEIGVSIRSMRER